MKIGIIGAGNVGTALANHFHKLNHTVQIANSRGPETLSEVAKQTGATPHYRFRGSKRGRTSRYRNFREGRAFTS